MPLELLHGDKLRLPVHTSASQLRTYASCPRKYKLRYLDGAEAEDRGPSLIVGSVVHSAVGWYFEQRLEGLTPSEDDAAEIGRADFMAELEGPPVRFGRWTKADLLEHTLGLIRFYLDHHKDLTVVAVERRVDVELTHPLTGEALPRPFLGYLDLTLEDGTVVELKTARSPYTATDMASSLQFGAYAAMLEPLGLHRLETWVIVKSKVPRMQRLPVVADEARVRWFLDAAVAIEGAIAAGHFPPAPSWSCGSCEYRGRCLGAVLATGASRAA